MDYGKNLKIARSWAEITQAELAQKAGIAVITVRQYESGKRKPSAKNWRLIANALHLTVEELDNAEDMLLRGIEGIGEIDLEAAKYAREDKRELLRLYSLLNYRGQQAAIDRLQELTEISRYRADYVQNDELTKE